jgi:hypothetical protein
MKGLGLLTSMSSGSVTLKSGAIHDGRVRVPAGRLHDLADEEADCLRLPGAIVGDGCGVGGQGGLDRGLDRAAVRDLAEAASRDDRRRRLAGRRMGFEDLATLRPRDRPG